MVDPQSPYRVLLAEDSDQDRELLEIACTHHGVAVDWMPVASCRELNAVIAEIAAGDRQAPHIAILDLRLPDGPSTGILAGLRAAMPEVPVVVFTTSSSSFDLESVRSHPGVEMLVKPHTFRGYGEILDRIRAAPVG